jgi:branched-chain amino acid transport system permease protein
MTLLLQQLANGLVIGSTYAVVGLGFALTFTVLRVINLAHPDFMMLTMYGVIVVVTLFAVNPFAAVVVALLGAIVLALVLERSVLRPLRGRDPLIPLIATAGVSQAIEYLVAYFFGSDIRSFPRLIQGSGISLAGVHLDAAQLVNVLVAVFTLVAISFYVRRTRFGLATRAVADRVDVSDAFGINVDRVTQITMIIAALLAGVAGLSLGNLYGSTGPFFAQFYTLKAFTVMLVAGNRYVEGVMAVGLVLGITEALVTGYVSSGLRDAAAFGAMLVILFFRPNGLFGSYES